MSQLQPKISFSITQEEQMRLNADINSYHVYNNFHSFPFLLNNLKSIPKNEIN